MISRLSSKLSSLTRGTLVLAFFMALIVYIGVTLPILQSTPGGDIIALDAQIFYTPEHAFETIASYGDAAGFWALMYITWDIITPILYTLSFALLISWLFLRGFDSDSKMQKLNVLPIGAGFFDVLENISIAIMLSVYPSEPVIIAWIATIGTVLKVSLLGISIFLVLIGVVKATINKFKAIRG